MTRKLLFPTVRKEAKYCFAYLFDFELQKEWLNQTEKHRFWDSLNYYAFDYLFDGIPYLYDGGYVSVGFCLYNKEEADIIYDYLNFLKEHFYGEMPDDYYVNHPKWPAVIMMAKDIVQIMEENEEEYNFKEDLEDYYYEHELRIIKEREMISKIQKISSFPYEEKDELIQKILSSNMEEFNDVKNKIMYKINAAKRQM